MSVLRDLLRDAAIASAKAYSHPTVERRHVLRQELPQLKGMLRTLLHYHLGTPILRTRQVMLYVQNLER